MEAIVQAVLVLAAAGVALSQPAVLSRVQALFSSLLAMLPHAPQPLPVPVSAELAVARLRDELPTKRDGLALAQKLADALMDNGVERKQVKQLIDSILPHAVVYETQGGPDA